MDSVEHQLAASNGANLRAGNNTVPSLKVVSSGADNLKAEQEVSGASHRQVQVLKVAMVSHKELLKEANGASRRLEPVPKAHGANHKLVLLDQDSLDSLDNLDNLKEGNGASHKPELVLRQAGVNHKELLRVVLLKEASGVNHKLELVLRVVGANHKVPHKELLKEASGEHDNLFYRQTQR